MQVLHHGAPLVDVKTDDGIWLQALNGADGAMLRTGTAMQAVLGLYPIRIPRIDALLRTVLKTGTAADTRIGINAETLDGHRRRVLVEGKDSALNGTDPQVKVVEHYVFDLKDNVDITRITGINVREIRLLGINYIAPVNLLEIRNECGNAGHANHLVKPRVGERLDAPIGHKLASHLLAARVRK